MQIKVDVCHDAAVRCDDRVSDCRHVAIVARMVVPDLVREWCTTSTTGGDEVGSCRKAAQQKGAVASGDVEVRGRPILGDRPLITIPGVGMPSTLTTPVILAPGPSRKSMSSVSCPATTATASPVVKSQSIGQGRSSHSSSKWSFVSVRTK